MRTTDTKIIFLILSGLALGLALAVLWTSLAHAAPRAAPRTAPACTHWAAANGAGAGCSEGQPCKIGTWLGSLAQPGTVLCLKDGTYRGEGSMIAIPEFFEGTAERPIVIRALVPGSVLIDGEDARRPINTQGAYGILSGVNATRGDNQNVMVRGHHWLIRDLMTWDVGTGGDTNIHMSGTDNTVEDCGAWGSGRKAIAAGAAGGDRNTIRRCWTRWEANEHPTSNPSVSTEVGYGQNGVTVENSIAMWNRKGRQTEPEGAGELFSSRNSKWLGSFFVIQHTDDYAPDTVFAAYVDAGSQSQQGEFNPLTNLVFKHNVAFIDPRHPGFGSKKGFYFAEGTDGGPPGTNNTVRDLVSVSGTESTFSSKSFPTSNTQWGRTLAQAIGEGKSLWTDSAAAPGICTRYVKGQLTEEGLWPWPMDKRLSDALVQSGSPAMSITAKMEELFGAIPAACRGGAPPAPATLEPPLGLSFEDRPENDLLVKWLDPTNTSHTGYKVERRTHTLEATSDYAVMTSALSASARDWRDVNPQAGALNCYVVSAVAGTATSGRSEEACRLVRNGESPPPEPPGPGPGTALTCTVVSGEGGTFVLHCQPQTESR